MPGLGMEGMYNWRAGSQERSIIKGNIEIITKYVDKKKHSNSYRGREGEGKAERNQSLMILKYILFT